MEKLEIKTNEFKEDCELRCKGWCHDIEMPYTIHLPRTEYFS